MGSIYALVALGFVLIYKSTSILNLAQGEFMMVGAYICLSMTLDFGLNFIASFMITMVFSVILGLAGTKRTRCQQVRRKNDMKKPQTYVAVALALVGVLALMGVIHLVFIFPKTLAIWAAEGHALSVAEQTLANVSQLCKTFGVLLIPVLVLAVIACGVWALLVGMRRTRGSANRVPVTD